MAMSRRSRRLSLIAGGLIALGLSAGLILTALSNNITFFMSPSEVMAAHPALGQRIRLGGLVEKGSVRRDEGPKVAFLITDGVATVPVAYTGVLPDLFREGQGVVVTGSFEAQGQFTADEVLAKHDENYMPPEVADALKKSGHWQMGEEGTPPAP